MLNEIKSDCVSLLPSPANIFHHTKWENHIYIHKVMEKLILICHTTLVIAVEHCIGYVQSACTRLCWSIDKHLKTAVKNSIRWYFPLGVDRLNDPSTHICFTPAMQERGGGGCPNPIRVWSRFSYFSTYLSLQSCNRMIDICRPKFDTGIVTSTC